VPIPEVIDAPRTVLEACICPLCKSSMDDGPVLDARERWFGIDGTFEIRECPRCRIGVTHPQLDGDALRRFYPSQYSQWHRSRRSLFNHGMALVTALRAELPPYGAFRRRAAGRLLDVGCGRGDLAARFLAHGWSAVGLDVSPEAVESARAAGVDAVEGTLTTASWPDASFDLIVMNHSLEHMPNPMEALRRARALLRPGGTLIVAVPNWACWQRRVFGTYWLHLDVPRHLTHLTPHALRAAAERAGFRRGRTRRCVTAVSLPLTLWSWLARPDVLSGRLRQAIMLIGAASYPLQWCISRPLGGDSVYLVAEA
jgi:SAM-dependent methyltransferase